MGFVASHHNIENKNMVINGDPVSFVAVPLITIVP
jgi:hypothetical protein